ncbi:hypothetical protein B0H16DRAFT_1834758 [Mycena metata]|uniref:Uncharacterized protein n=1 Tax=Mycena metata TaxID=1033252 RepID=A0AAD7J394_9AGAR|nr:hypothetical protein B0H16DRAFT_1834758 [Mycena metata]
MCRTCFLKRDSHQMVIKPAYPCREAAVKVRVCRTAASGISSLMAGNLGQNFAVPAIQLFRGMMDGIFEFRPTQQIPKPSYAMDSPQRPCRCSLLQNDRAAHPFKAGSTPPTHTKANRGTNEAVPVIASRHMSSPRPPPPTSTINRCVRCPPRLTALPSTRRPRIGSLIEASPAPYGCWSLPLGVTILGLAVSPAFPPVQFKTSTGNSRLCPGSTRQILASPGSLSHLPPVTGNL